MTADQPAKPKAPARIVVTLRVALTGKLAWIVAAKKQGYKDYTAWMRDVLAAEAMTPKHKPTPKPKKRGST